MRIQRKSVVCVCVWGKDSLLLSHMPLKQNSLWVTKNFIIFVFFGFSMLCWREAFSVFKRAYVIQGKSKPLLFHRKKILRVIQAVSDAF